MLICIPDSLWFSYFIISLSLSSGTQLFTVIKWNTQEYVLQQHIYFKKEYFIEFFSKLILKTFGVTQIPVSIEGKTGTACKGQEEEAEG